MIWHRIASISVVVMSGILFVTTLVVGFMMFVDGTIWRPVVTYDSTILPVDKGVYSPGELVLAKVEFYKSRDEIGEMKWNLVNHKIIAFSPRKISIPSGVTEKWFPVEKLPQCEKGEYHFEGLVSYRVNPLRVVTYKLKTQPFLIMPDATGVKESKS